MVSNVSHGLSQSVPAELLSTQQAQSIRCPSTQGFSTLGKGLRHLWLDPDSTSSWSTRGTSSSPATLPRAASRRHLLVCCSSGASGPHPTLCPQEPGMLCHAHSFVQRMRPLPALILSQLNLHQGLFPKGPKVTHKKIQN